MKNKKIRLPLLLLSAALIISCLSGCFMVDSAKIEDVVGTYQLTNYQTKQDMIENNDIVLYVVINKDGSGYYAYSDSDTELYYSELTVRFIADDERPELYEYVEMNFKGDWEKFGIHKRTKTLNSYLPKYKGNLIDKNLAFDYYENVDFKKVDSATDLSYINSVLGEIPKK